MVAVAGADGQLPGAAPAMSTMRPISRAWGPSRNQTDFGNHIRTLDYR
jgi:hypothetical protein